MLYLLTALFIGQVNEIQAKTKCSSLILPVYSLLFKPFHPIIGNHSPVIHLMIRNAAVFTGKNYDHNQNKM